MKFQFSHVTGIPSRPYQCQLLSVEHQSWNLVCWGLFLLKTTFSITDNLLCAPLPAIPVAGYIFLGAGTRGSPWAQLGPLTAPQPEAPPQPLASLAAIPAG